MLLTCFKKVNCEVLHLQRLVQLAYSEKPGLYTKLYNKTHDEISHLFYIDART